MADINQVLNTVFAQLRQQEAALNQLRTSMSGANPNAVRGELNQRIDETRALIADVENRMRASRQDMLRPQTIDDVPGVRTPSWQRVIIPFTQGETSSRVGTVEIPPEGPFVLTQCQPHWRSNDQTNQPTLVGRLLPCTARFIIDNQAGALALSPNITTNIAQIPEFNFRLATSGSGRFWTGQDEISAAAFYGGMPGPLHFGIMGFVDPTDRIQITALPQQAVPHDGAVEFEFHGFQILNSIRMAQILGYAS